MEILVAFSILGLALGVLLNIFSGGLRSAIVSEEYQQALSVAESLLARAGTELVLENGVMQGTELDKYAWTLQGTPFEMPVAKNSTDQVVQAQMKASKIQVKVEWAEGEDSRALMLTTIRLMKVQL